MATAARKTAAKKAPAKKALPKKAAPRRAAPAAPEPAENDPIDLDAIAELVAEPRLAPVREFTTDDYDDGGSEEVERVELPFTIDGVNLMAYVPTLTQIGLVGRATSRSANMGDRLDAYTRLVEDSVSSLTWRYISERLEDPDDRKFGFKALGELAVWIINEFVDRHPEVKAKMMNGPQRSGRGRRR